MPIALITGITGQDGSYLSELLLAKGYAVHGLMQRHSAFTTWRIEPFMDRLQLHYGDLLDGMRMAELIHRILPDEIYHLGAQSVVHVSYDEPCYTTQSISLGVLHVLEAVRQLYNRGHYTRVYQASSSEMFGDMPAPQDENTPFGPRSPYACAKVHAYYLTRMYREAYGVWVANGILFNHESPRRGETFVTRKITRAVAAIRAGRQDRLLLGNPEARRDWGYAKEYVEAMWLMLQQERPDDYVVATGRSHTVREWVQWAFEAAGLDADRYVEYNHARHVRPLDISELRGNAEKAARLLGWRPQTSARELCRLMVAAERY